MQQNFYSHGKLLLTGEYLVLDGAKALGLPTKYGQKLSVNSSEKNRTIHWKSFLKDGQLWLDIELSWDKKFRFSTSSSTKEANKLIDIFNCIAAEKPSLFSADLGYAFTSTLEFNKDWGLGSSSTLINNLAEWSQIDAFDLQHNTFGGSGYDIACAKHDQAILYKNSPNTWIEKTNFNPIFKEELFFVYLNQKQNSREAIKHYRNESPAHIQLAIERTNAITEQLIHTTKIEDFERLLLSHENIIASLLKQHPIKKQLFSDYTRCIKSLGAWGGDFILATGTEKEKDYFREKGYKTILCFDELVL